MESIHNLSSIAPLPEFDLWGVPPTQVTIEKNLEIEYKPIAVVDGKSQISFQITSAIDEYIKLDQIFLYWTINVMLKKKDNETPVQKEDWDEIKFSNYLQHAMIKEVQIMINNSQVSHSPHNYPYRAFIETLLGFSKNSKESFLSSACWNEDDIESSHAIKPLSTNLSKGKTLDMMSRLHTDLSFQGRALLGGTTLDIQISLTNPPFYLKIPQSKGIEVSIGLSSVSLFVNKAKVSPLVVDAHRKALSISPVKYPVTRIEVKQATIPSGVVDYSADNIIFGQLPRRVLMFFVDRNSYAGSYSSDPFDLKHFNLNHLCAIYDGQQYPSKAYTPDFKNNLYVREYFSLYNALNQSGTDCYLHLTWEKFELMPIFAINFAPDLSDGAGMIGHFSQIKRGALRLQMKFDEALTEVINVLLYCEFDNIIEINSEGSVSTNYHNGFFSNN